MPSTPMYQSQGSYNQYNTATTPMASHTSALTSFAHAQYGSQTAPRPALSTSNSHSGHSNVYNPPRTIEVYTLPEPANHAIPKEVRDQFRTDEKGRVLFFTAPPLAVNPVPADKQKLGHSLRYLADKARNKQADAQKRKEYEEWKQNEAKNASKRIKLEQENQLQTTIENNVKFVEKWSSNFDAVTEKFYQDLYGENWKEMREVHLAKLAIEQAQATLKQKEAREFEIQKEAAKELKINGRGL